jgi:cysteine desulfurase
LDKPAIYLDHAATTATRKEVVEAMLPYLGEIYGNPSSLHVHGRQAHKALEQARSQVATLLNAPSAESLIFTSGGTEAINMAVKGIAFGLQSRGKHIITSRIEHSATLEPIAWLAEQGWEVTYLQADEEGFLNPADLAAVIRPDTVLISLIHGNNEVGTLQDLEALGRIARTHGIVFHADTVQTLGKFPLDLSVLPLDLLSCSGHKLYGPKGTGFLYATEQARHVLTPWIHGGGQQDNLRSGTENLAGIVGLAKALELMTNEREDLTAALYELQEALISGIEQQVPSARLNGPRELRKRVPGNVNFSFAPVEGEVLVLRFDLEGISVSSGSACHSSILQGSHVLHGMGRNDVEAKSSVRFSLGRENTMADIEAVLDVLPRVLQKAGYFRSHPLTATIG